jgi:hypothetical protein
MNTIIYAGVSLILAIFAAFIWNEFQNKNLEIANLNTAVSEYETLVAKLEASNAQSKTLITKQNEVIEEITTDRELALNKLEEWRAKPPKVRYEVIYKDREVIKSNECDDIKSRLDDVRGVDFNSL